MTGVSILTGSLGCKRPYPEVLDAIDASMRRFIHDAGVSAGQLAILRDGTTIFSKVYADAPPAGYAAVTQQTLFRLASGSKMFTCAAIYALQTRGQLDLNQRVFPLLGVTKPALAGNRPDPHIDDITVQHLVDHAGGWNIRKPFQVKGGPLIPSTGCDPMFRIRQIALDLGLSAPPTKLDVARYMYGKPLQFVPGTLNYTSSKGATYGNFGYMLLGLVVEAVTGQRFIDFVRDGLDGKGAWPGVLVSPMVSREKNPAEVWYVASTSGPTVFEPKSDAILPSAYGGGGFITELMDSAAGMMTNAETLARFASRHAVSGLGGRTASRQRDGSMPGTYSDTMSRPNGIDCAYVLNTKEFGRGIPTGDKFSGLLRLQLDAL
jgi:CubicO group peptidase (beta-lactamase class C family)